MSTERVVNTFIELVKIDSESKHEGKFQEFLKQKFDALGLEVMEDNTKEKTGLGANNLIARLPGNAEADAMFFSCHVDTVAPGRNIQPVIRDGIIYSEGVTILAADDKAGIAVMIELIEQIKEKSLPHGMIEFVLSPGEEIGLVGAAALDPQLIKSEFGFVLDSGGPVGGITVASPSLYGIEVIIKGETAHAGLEPEKGVSAIEIAAKAIANMKLGRIDKDTTANIGTIHGGVASNIVADEVQISAEARSIDHEICEEQVNHMIDLFKNKKYFDFFSGRDLSEYDKKEEREFIAANICQPQFVISFMTSALCDPDDEIEVFTSKAVEYYRIMQNPELLQKSFSKIFY